VISLSEGRNTSGAETPARPVGRAYGTGREPDADKPDYARRESFLVGPDGTIAKAYTVSDVNTHPDQVLADLRELQAGL
jgi:peroxiredoxin